MTGWCVFEAAEEFLEILAIFLDEEEAVRYWKVISKKGIRHHIRIAKGEVSQVELNEYFTVTPEGAGWTRSSVKGSRVCALMMDMYSTKCGLPARFPQRFLLGQKSVPKDLPLSQETYLTQPSPFAPGRAARLQIRRRG